MPLFKRQISMVIDNTFTGLQQSNYINNDFHMLFTCKKTSSSDPNTCKAVIYNINNTTRSNINEPNSSLIVNAGYEQGEGLELVFIGNIVSVSTARQGSDNITTIDARDGDEPLTLTRDSFSFREGVSVKQLIKSVINKFKIAVKSNVDLVEFTDKQYTNGFAFLGQLRTLLDTLTDEVGLSWSIQNNELKIYNDKIGDLLPAIVLNKDTGLIGIPERIKITKGKQTEKVEIDGWKLTSLLQPSAEPGSIVVVSSVEIGNEKQFKIETVEHAGDNFEGDFQTRLEVVEIE